MKKLIYIVTSIFTISCHSQEKNTPQAIQDDALTISTTGGMNGGCKFLEQPVYYVNENYIIYQDCNTRKILYADISSFEIVKYYGQYGIALDKNGVYVQGNFVATDTTGFTFLGIDEKDLLWKTNTSVYKNTTVLPKLNASEFTRLSDQQKKSYSGIYFKDNSNIYYFDKKIEGADLATADLIYNDNRMFYDKNYMYKDGEIVFLEAEPLLYVNNSLKKTATKVLYHNKVISNIDTKTLVGLSRHYAKDKNNVYSSSFGDDIKILPINKADFNKLKVWDHTNSAYSSAAYSKGAVFLEQLGYVIGSNERDKGMHRYWNTWQFKHPNVNDFVRVMEKESGLELDWYKEYWVNGTKTIDYGIDSLWEEGGKSKVRIKRLNEIPMPIDLVVTFKDGTQQMHYIPAYLMFGQKPAEDQLPRTVYPAWKWTHTSYVIEFDKRLTELTTVEIDPSHRMADVDRRNNKLELKW